MKYEVVERSRNVHDIRMRYHRGFEQWFLLRSDAHHDNPHCNQEMERRHLQMALERDAGIIDNGDLFCAMQGNYDPRKSKEDIRPEHQCNNYLDALVRTAADFYEPFSQSFIVIAQGNHESSILKRHETNLSERLVATLNERTGSRIRYGGFSGWVRFCFERDGERRGAGTQTINLWRHHGYGGGGPVTRGVIQTNRQAVYLPDAHIVMTGHTHDGWIMPIERLRISSHGVISKDKQWHIKIPTYKEEYGDGFGGWHIERGAPPKPVGAYWLRFYYERNAVRFEIIFAD